MNNSSQTLITNDKVNSTYDAGSYEADWLDVLQFTLFAIIFLVSTTGNVLVCLVVAFTGRMRTTRNYLLVNLAVSDLTVALLCIPFDVVVRITAPRWPLGDAMCKLLWPSMTLVTNSSAATLAAISYDRYRAVVRPMKSRFTTRQTGIIIATIWVVSLVLVLPYVLALRVNNNTCKEIWPSDTIRKIYTVGLFLFQYALPLTIIAIAYTKVVLKLRTQAARMAKNSEIMMKPPSPPPAQETWHLKTHLAPAICDNASLVTPLSGKKLFLNGDKDTKMSDTTFLSLCQTKNMLFRNGSKDKQPCTESNYLVPQIEDKQSLASPLPPRKLPSNGNKWRPRYLGCSSSGRQKEARRLEHNTKIVKMLVSVVLLYAICLLPNQVVWLWYEFGAGQNWPHINELLIFGSLMVYINSSVNPLLYAGMNEEFRKGFARILRCQWRQRQPEIV